ncbi:outer membrane beta-barrel protein [Aequorivita sp. SDUM287046]|uniref:Outer membrane beta-barrel protein n=1 Tax=Aequorivita aurantiaca TaxID=3053356 RepID=A0ABT8DH09_9FLAO|nr:outer membrane beta-barrel protein [Aequorivita aurantiaca]MDN3723231.1 outer membrane beta-barrel protein [Aequorivita aurantiaca]
MKEKKNIDNIFNEGFKNFEATPSPRVWENIQAQLKKEKEDRKVIPLWIKLGSVAALLAVMLSVGNWVFSPSDLGSPSITDENVQKTEEKLHEDSKFEKEIRANETQVASEENTLQNESTKDLTIFEDKATINENKAKSSDRNNIKSSENSNLTVIASSNSDNKNLKSKDNSRKDLIDKNSQKNKVNERIANSDKSSEKINADKKEYNETLINTDKSVFDYKKEGLAIKGNSEKNKSKKNLVKTEEEVAEDSKNKKSIFDAIAEKDELAPPTEKSKKEKPEHRWNVAPTVAPVYYSSLGNGSSIDPAFADNPQKGDVNMSYGVQVSYALNNRLSVRTGVNNVDLSYSTSDIEVGTGPVAYALSSVDYGGRNIVTTVVDKGAFATAAPSNGFGDVRPKSTQGDARLIQNINYYEVPVELKYAVLDTKLGVNVIGGVSTLFLGSNEVSVKADNFNTVLGDANNLSSVSFSTNVGLGLDYKLSKKFTFNIEPMFKYQLNPYTDSSVNFKPYYLGVYSGLSFKF